MTKRFVDYFDKDHNYIIQDLVNEDEYQVGYANCDEDMFLELVNALAETSCDCITDCEIVVRKLKEENEQLKQQVQNIHKLIDNKIKEYQKYDEYDTEKYYIGTQLLKELKKELNGDVE